MKEKTLPIWFDLSECPKAMKAYLKANNFHFNKRACDEAIRGLKRNNPATGKVEGLTDIRTKDEVESILTKHGVKLENDCLYDAVWAYHMLMSDFWKSAIEDEAHLVKAVKDVIDDPDQPDGILFHRWVEDRAFAGIPIDWESLL